MQHRVLSVALVGFCLAVASYLVLRGEGNKATLLAIHERLYLTPNGDTLARVRAEPMICYETLIPCKHLPNPITVKVTAPTAEEARALFLQAVADAEWITEQLGGGGGAK